MAFIRTQVELDRDTGLSADKTVLTFHWITDEVGTLEQEVADIDAALDTWIQAVDGLLSAELSGVGRYLHYDLEEAPPRVPAFESDAPALTPATTALPSQMSFVVRYNAQYVSGTNRQRLRGRQYLGPIGSNTTDSTGERTVDAGNATTIGNAYAALIGPLTATNSGSSIIWCLFSRRTAHDVMGIPYDATDVDYTGPALVAAFEPIVRVTVPNHFGVQRRRKVASSPTLTHFT